MAFDVISKSKRELVFTLNSGHTVRLPTHGSSVVIVNEERNSPELACIEQARHVVVRPVKQIK